MFISPPSLATLNILSLPLSFSLVPLRWTHKWNFFTLYYEYKSHKYDLRPYVEITIGMTWWALMEPEGIKNQSGQQKASNYRLLPADKVQLSLKGLCETSYYIFRMFGAFQTNLLSYTSRLGFRTPQCKLGMSINKRNKKRE